jgi:hypothetical protein
MDPMNDVAFERDIERALAIEPSPEFVARVRSRIAEEPSPLSRRFGWLFTGLATAAVAAAVVLALFVVSPPRQTAPASPPLLVSRSVASGSVVVPAIAPADRAIPSASRTSPVVRMLTPFVPSATRVAAVPEPLIDARETRALQRLIAGVRDARVDLSPLLMEAPPAPMALQPIDDLVIPPITIEPLVSGGVEGERP